MTHKDAGFAAEFHRRLQRAVAGDVLTDEYHRALYSTDASLYQIQPLAVVVPRTVEDVQVAVQLAAEQGVPIIPRGSGTSLSGQSVGAGLVLDFSKYLNRILDLDPTARTARVQPGVVLDALNAEAARHGLQFGADVATSSRANLGGMIGNNSAGSRSIRQGKTVDHVAELNVLLADGAAAHFKPWTPEELARVSAGSDPLGHIAREVQRLVREHADEIAARFPPIVRRVSGYNLDVFVPDFRAAVPAPPLVQEVRGREQACYGEDLFNLAPLIVGAEGTLAVVTEALVHLAPLPASRGVVVLHFDSMTAAVAGTLPILEFEPSAVELLDGQIIRLAERSLEYRHYLDFVVGHPESLVLVEFSGDSASEVRAKADAMIVRLRGTTGLFHVLSALEPATYAHVWACRKASLPLLMGVPGARKPIAFVEDTAVDPRRLPEFVARFVEIIKRAGTTGAFYGHASVGCLHIRPMLDAANRDDLARLARISEEICGLVLEFGGAMSGEHGDGLARSYLNERLFGPRLYQAFRELKAAFDPAGILNPGKIVDGPSPIENLRTQTPHAPPQVITTLDFTREGGFRAAAELCNGAGVCRKLRTGTMCPSFMATGEEEHSTRGRANGLRLVLSGALPASDLVSPKLKETFDLCLSCKGCKAECPSNVDAAKLKAEFLSHYYAAHGTPRSVWLTSRIATLNRWGARLAPVSNWATRLPGAAWMAHRLLGVDPRRPLPRFARNHFAAWFDRRAKPTPGARGPIVLLDDCLTSYCEPQVNRSAVTLLEAAGYEVQRAALGCCGRAAISQGQLGLARGMALANLSRLAPFAERNIPIVGSEPSCLLMLVDEYPDLVPGPRAVQVAGAAELVEAHLARLGMPVPLEEHPGRALLHGHCHQKALVGMTGVRSALDSVPGLEVSVVDSGCCGMAGAFGYEHYDVSMKIGERVLLPAVRAAGQEDVILAPGFSCRQQILHGAGRRALHPVELLAECLAPRR